LSIAVPGGRLGPVGSGESTAAPNSPYDLVFGIPSTESVKGDSKVSADAKNGTPQLLGISQKFFGVRYARLSWNTPDRYIPVKPETVHHRPRG
jgi:hypothetical protein